MCIWLQASIMSTSTKNFNSFLLIHCVYNICSLMYCILYTEFVSYSSSSTLNSTCDYPGSLNDRKWPKERGKEGGRERLRNDFINVYIHCYPWVLVFYTSWKVIEVGISMYITYVKLKPQCQFIVFIAFQTLGGVNYSLEFTFAQMKPINIWLYTYSCNNYTIIYMY